MAHTQSYQSYQSPDLVQDDTNTTEQPSGEKKSVFGKLKERTKKQTTKLRDKLKPGSGADAAGDDTRSSGSSSEDEADVSTNNEFSGMTQPQDERKMDSEELPSTTDDSDSVKLNAVTPGPVTAEDFSPSQGQDESALSKQFEGLSTNDKPASQTDVVDSTTSRSDKSGENTALDDAVGGKFDTDFATPKDDILTKVGNPTADDTTVKKEEGDPEGLLSGTDQAEAPKTWGQWVGEKVGLAKPSSPTNAKVTSETSTDDKPISEKIQDTLVEAKDAGEGKISEVTDAVTAEENKEGTSTTDSHKQTYTQKLTGAIYGAKDTLMSSTHPGDEDKALSQKVTETVSNLPTTIKSTLGFGGNKSTTVTSPTTTPGLVEPIPTEDSPSTPPQSPGIVSRITGSVTSLFGKKQPSDSPNTSGHLDNTTATSGVPTSETTTAETEN